MLALPSCEVLCVTVLLLKLYATEASGFWNKWAKSSGDFSMKLIFKNQMAPFNLTILDEGLDSPQTTPELVTKSGFPIEVHHVVTEDGYVLEMHRIPHGKSRNSSAWRKTPVLILHGYACTSIHWVLNREEDVLPYMLAERGYDVWLGNFRGNRYSNRHLRFGNYDTRFWNFSWHEMGLFDVPAMIDYILEETKQSQLMYAAHSMGTTAFYVCMSIRTEYNAKIKGMFALAPVAYFKHFHNPAKLITPLVVSDKLALDALGHGELVPPNLLDSFRIFGAVLCAPDSSTAGLCDQFLHHVAGFNPVQLNKTWVPMLFRNYPDSSSTRTLLHFLQLLKSGKFCQYDYGVMENFRIYSRLRPPSYNLSRVTAPIAIFWSQDDWLATPEDVIILRRQLPNVILYYKVESRTFSHLDFLCAVDAGRLLYDKVIESMSGITMKLDK